MTTDAQLDTLEAKGLIRLATLQPELEYLFRHALVQDAAYESLLKQERRELHRTVGEAIEQLYPERSGELAAMLAQHFEQAGEGARAVPYLVDAARYAYARNAIVEAYDLFGRAAELLPARTDSDPPELRRQRVEIVLGRVKAGFSFMNEQDQIALLEPLVDEVEALGDLRLAADVHLHLALLRQFQGERYETSAAVRRSLDRSAEIAKELNDPVIAAMPRSLIGMFQVFFGELEAGVKALREVAPLLEAGHAFVGSSFALVGLAIGLSRLGRFDEAAEAARHASEIAKDGDIISRLDSLIGESTVRSLRGDLEGAIPIAMQCTTLSEQTGATACVVASNFVLGDAYMRQGQFKSAQIAFERGNEVAESFQERGFRPSISAYIRANAAQMGEADPQVKSFEDSLALARTNGDKFGEANIIWKRAETEAKKPDGNREQMLADFAAAADAFAAMGGRPYLARTLRGWGLALRDLGRAQDGDEKLRRALELFDEMGITREADELRGQLA